MPKHTRRTHSPAFKAKVAPPALRSDSRLATSPPASKCIQAIDSLEELLPEAAPSGEHEEEIKTLHANTVELSMEKDFLSKARARGL